MIIVAGTIRVAADSQSETTPHAQTMVAETRKEDGCIVYSFAWDVVDPGLIRVYEEWESQGHLDAHMNTPHMAAWRAALGEIGVIERNVKILQGEQIGSV